MFQENKFNKMCKANTGTPGSQTIQLTGRE